MKNIIKKFKIYSEKLRATNQTKLRNEFLPEALEIIEKPTSPIGPLMIILISVIITSFLVWSFFGRIDTVASARGTISTVTGIQNIQSESGGMVSEILVKEGDKVKAGQAIFLLDDSVNEITLESTKEGVSLLEFENTLLDAVLKNENIAMLIDNVHDENKLKVFDYVRALENNFKLKQSEAKSIIEQMRLQVEIEKDNASKVEDNIAFLESRKELLTSLFEEDGPEKKDAEKLDSMILQKEKEYEDYKVLYEAKVISKAEFETFSMDLEQLKKEKEIQGLRGDYESADNKMKLSDIESQILNAKKDITSQKNVVLQSEQKLEQAKRELEGLEADFVTNISKLIVDNRDEIVVQKANLDIQVINLGRQTLSSPVNGIVKTLEVKTEGGVIAPMQIAATVLSDNDQLIADIDILNKDIGYIKTGQKVTIKLDTFNFQKFGKLDGELIFVGPDAVYDEKKGWIYKAKVALNDANFRKRSQEVVINSGMECTAEVKISERRVIEFFLEPVFEYFDGSLSVK